MSKRKQTDPANEDSDGNIVDVDFEFFDPIAEIDWHAIKYLLGQLFQSDSEMFYLQDLTNLILSQPLLGSTVKCDGRESDPSAFLSVINVQKHQTHPSIKALNAYLLQKSTPDTPLKLTLQSILGQSESHVGLILSERLINMPVQIVPPMYRMLLEEIKWALEENEPYDFKYLLFISRTYSLSAEEAAEPEAQTTRLKRRKGPDTTPPSRYSFHSEDEFIKKFASHTLDYSFTNSPPRDKESFGLDTAGSLMLMPADRFQLLVTALDEAYAPPS